MRAIASLNAGSSSIKFALFTLETSTNPVLAIAGKIEKIGIEPEMAVRSANGAISRRDIGPEAEH